ncbi:hypothetical protein TSUD_252690 [Trifolium subterraneum]|nr:hypothetical protein TSUD_252690 [Trifolium subterraneum]
MGNQTEIQTGFKLVGFKNFVRTNPKSDRFKIKRFHHVEFWCTDATNTARRFSWGLGMPIVAKSDLSTGNLTHASYLLRSGDLSLLFSAAYSPSISLSSPSSTASIPTFDATTCFSFSASHGLAVRAVAVEVDDAEFAFTTSVNHGAIPASPPVNLDNRVKLAEVRLYGDVVLRYISYNNPNQNPNHWFLPGFEPVPESSTHSSLDFGIRRLDHAVGNVPELSSAVKYLKEFTGFHEFAEFTAEDVGTSESGLNSVALANNDETVLFPMNEPVYGMKRKSQIETYLEHNEGAGHCGGAVRSNSALESDDFAVVGSPTIFIEIIQRVGCMLKDEEGKEYQKGGCGGFGKGNFSELFKSVEEYEKTLEARRTA